MGVVRLVDALAEQGDGGAGGGDGDGQGEGAAVLEGEPGGEVFARAEFGAWVVGGQREAKVVFGLRVRDGFAVSWFEGAGRGGEGEVVEDELLDLIEAGAGKLSGGVAGVEVSE